MHPALGFYISISFFFFLICIPPYVPFFFPFFLFLFPPDLCFEEECWAVECCSMIMIMPYIIHHYKYHTGAHYFLQSFFHSAEVSIVPTILISLVLTLIPLSGYPRYSTNDIVVLPLGWGYPSVFPTNMTWWDTKKRVRCWSTTGQVCWSLPHCVLQASFPVENSMPTHINPPFVLHHTASSSGEANK